MSLTGDGRGRAYRHPSSAWSALRLLLSRQDQASREAHFLAAVQSDWRESFTGTLDEFIAAGGLRSEPQA